MKFFFAFTLAASVAALVIAVPVGPKAQGGVMAELENLAAVTALLSKQPASDSDAQLDVQESTQAKETNTPMTKVFHGGYTFFRVPFKSSTSSNADILATCKSHGFIAPCDLIWNGYPVCGGCTEVPKEAHPSQQDAVHFGYGGYKANTYSWPGGLEGWKNFFTRPSGLHIFANNVNEGCQKSTRAAVGSHDWMYRGASHGFCLCAIKGKIREDTSKYENRHAAEAIPILDMLDAIRIKISTNAAKGIKQLDTAKAALKAAEKTYEEKTASVQEATKLTTGQASVDQRELDMLNKIVEMVHSLNGRGCDSNEKGESCAEILKKCPGIASGVYTIAPASQTAQKLYCDMKTDGGGWTLIYKTDKSNANDRTTGETNVAALQNADLNAVAKVSDAFGNALGKEFRISSAGKTMFVKSQALPIFRTTDAAAIAGQWNKPRDKQLVGLANFRYSSSDSWSNGNTVLHGAHSPCFNIDGNWNNLHFCFNRWCCGSPSNGLWINGGGVSAGYYAGTVFVR